MKPLERILCIACASLIILALLMLCYSAGKAVYADYLFYQAIYEPTFLSAEKMMLKALRVMPNNPHYEDRAGVVYYEVLGLSGDKKAYDNASLLFYQSYLHNPYDPQSLIHLIQLDILAIKRGLIDKPTQRGLWACDAARSLDSNNQTVKDLAEELRGMK